MSGKVIAFGVIVLKYLDGVTVAGARVVRISASETWKREDGSPSYGYDRLGDVTTVEDAEARARRLADKNGVPYVGQDAMNWRPGDANMGHDGYTWE